MGGVVVCHVQPVGVRRCKASHVRSADARASDVAPVDSVGGRGGDADLRGPASPDQIPPCQCAHPLEAADVENHEKLLFVDVKEDVG